VVASQSGLAVADELGTWFFTQVGESVLASTALLRGDLLGAGRHLSRLRSVVPSSAASTGCDAPVWLDLRLADANGDVERTRRDLDLLQANLPVHSRLLVEEPAAAAWLTRTALRLGDRPAAERVVRRAETLAVTNPQWTSLLAAADHARGVIDRDLERLERAAAGHRRSWARGSAWEDAGRLLAGRGARVEARDGFARAARAYHEAGASRDEARVARRVEHASRPTRRTYRPVSGWESLTDTERRVADVVAEGLTNAESARRLYLSRHTVDFHLRQIFRKLAIRSRVELVRMVLQADDH
jgi:DNA-binding CsgD family transcriptional regulator